MGRVYTIDYLRGLLALLVMIYHYGNWGDLFTPEASSFLTRNALYGVSLFFIISGFSLTVTYFHRFNRLEVARITDYFFKRFARIYPLFWLIVCLFLIFVLLTGKDFPDTSRILSNLTISFAFFEGQKGLTPGSWSIGIEIVFYVLLPIVLYSLHVIRSFRLILFIVSIGLLLYLSSYTMYDTTDIDDYWSVYLNLINHVYFFVFGIFMGVLFLEHKTLFMLKTPVVFAGLAILLVFLVWYPIEGSIVSLLYQENRIALSVVYFLVFYLFVTLHFILDHNRLANKVFEHLGDISYTVYLLHPLVYKYLHYFLSETMDLGREAMIVVMIASTVVLSGLIYKMYEIPAKKYLLSWKYSNV